MTIPPPGLVKLTDNSPDHTDSNEVKGLDALKEKETFTFCFNKTLLIIVCPSDPEFTFDCTNE